MDEKVNSSSLIREAVDAGVNKPKAIVEWVREKHGVEVKLSLVNNVKFHYRKKTAPAKRGRPKGSTSTSAPAAPAAPAALAAALAAPAPLAPSGNGASLAIEDIVAVKELVDRFGKEGLAKLVEVL
ncbi:MAG: hypothetical protein K2X38_09985 [Gemmataceae bacterium]|nr:hypothetical protein [Gemmataceae bacterium]